MEITEELGVDSIHESGASGRLWLPEIMGGGLALLDADGDGDLDLYLINGNDTLPDPRAAAGVTNRFYRREAEGGFVDATASSGLGDTGFGMGVACGDYDNDGDIDVYVTNLGDDRLYRNVGDGRFEDATNMAGISVSGWSCSAAFFDGDADGFLDLYVTRYLDWNPEQSCTLPAGQRDYCGPRAFHPVHDVLLRNKGDGTFVDISHPSGVAAVLAAGLGVVSGDFDGDGRQDVYVANDAHANNLWINQGDGTFQDRAGAMGVAVNGGGMPEAGMGVTAVDLDDNGFEDFYVTHLIKESNTCYVSVGDGSGFNDATARLGLRRDSFPLTGFGTCSPDLDLDGHQDLVVANGGVNLLAAPSGCRLEGPWNRMAQPNLVYVQDAQSGGFELVTREVATFSEPPEITRGVVAADLDGDGDLDLVTTNIAGRARLYRNVAPKHGSWLRVRATDPALRRDALGARITLVRGPDRRLRTLRAAEGYLTSCDPVVTFGIPGGPGYDGLEVRWVDGLVERFPGGDAPAEVRLIRGEGESLR